MAEKRWTDLSTGKTYAYNWARDVSEAEDSVDRMLKSYYGDSWKNRARYVSYHKVEPARYVPKIKKVIYNDPATIVYWSDCTKTVVKCQEDDVFDAQTGLLMAIAKKALAGNRGRYCNELEKFGAPCKKNAVEETAFDRMIRRMREDINEAKKVFIDKLNGKE